MNGKLKNFLAFKAFNIREGSILSTTQAGSGHPTSALSAADVVAVLFFYVMRFDVRNPDNPNNDRFILSKGHAAPVLYAVLQQLGVITKDELMTLRSIDSRLEGHPTRRFTYVEAATGSLGQGLSIGAGIAMSAKKDKRTFRTYVLLGDSEVSEGSIWEAVEMASFYKLNNLIAILDCNRLGQANETMLGHEYQRYVERFSSFGWYAMLVDGHDVEALAYAFDSAQQIENKPVIIIAKTFKGYGVDLAQDQQGYHGRAFKKEELPLVLEQLRNRFPQEATYMEDYAFQPQMPSSEPSKQIGKIILPRPSYKQGEQLPTRKAYGQALIAAGKACDQIIVLDGEVKNSTFSELFEKEFPEQFVECFIAEQNMIGMAVGFALRGKIPLASTFGAFMTRAFDQIRMAAIGQTALRLCGSHAGVSIGEDGPSQMGLEDIAMMRTLPDSVVLYPSDALSTYKLVEQMVNYRNGISYIRTTRAETPIIYENNEEFSIGGCKIIRQSAQDRALVVAAGITLHEALKAYDELVKEGIFITVIDLYSIKPLDQKTLLNAANAAGKKVITVEDHYQAGGIGEAVISALANQELQIESLAVKQLPRSGKPQELLAMMKIDYQAIINTIKKL